MKSMVLMQAIGNIDDRFVEEADPIQNSTYGLAPMKKSIRFSPWLKLAAPLAACLIIAVAVFGLPNLFTNPNDPSGVIPPTDTAVVPPTPPALETLTQIGFYGDYSTFAELIALSEQSGQDIENKISEIRESYLAHPSGYFINLEKKADLELLSQLLQQPYFPVTKDIKPLSIELYYVFSSSDDTTHGDEHWQVSLQYEISGNEYGFTIAGSESENVILEFERNAYWELELIRVEGDIRVFLKKPRNADVVVPESVIYFGLDVRGLWVDTTVVSVGDVQSAIDGILSFDFKPFTD